jgi:hypothetical protein
MSDTARPGPALSEQVEEVQGVFPSDAALQDAIARLTRAGFDRADFSLPEAAPAPSRATPEGEAGNPNTEDDQRQTRTLGNSMAASAGAMAAAGAVIATGGAALPAVAAAVAGGVGLGAATNVATTASNKVEHDEREEAAARGELVLSVRTNAARRSVAEEAMRAAGSTRVEPVLRAASWTG